MFLSDRNLPLHLLLFSDQTIFIVSTISATSTRVTVTTEDPKQPSTESISSIPISISAETIPGMITHWIYKCRHLIDLGNGHLEVKQLLYEQSMTSTP